MGDQHRELRYTYEIDADAPRMSRRAELGFGVASTAVMVACAFGTRYGYDNEQPILGTTFAVATIGSANIASRLLLRQLDEGLTYVSNLRNRNGA